MICLFFFRPNDFLVYLIKRKSGYFMQIAYSIPKEITENIDQLSDDEKMALVLRLLQDIRDENFSKELLQDEDIHQLFASQASFSWIALQKIHKIFQQEKANLEEAEFNHKLINFLMDTQKTIPFEKWKTQNIEHFFNLEENQGSSTFDDWLNSSIEISEEEIKLLTKYQEKLRRKANFWNEEELKVKFIAPLLELVDYDSSDLFQSFLERKINTTIQDIRLSGKVDFLLARGKQFPYAPYFCLHEYKREQGVGPDNDPLGQLLIAMLALHEENEEKIPIYGAYVMGRNWFFVLLEGKKYTVSRQYDATQDDLFDILRILKQVKVNFESYLKNK